MKTTKELVLEAIAEHGPVSNRKLVFYTARGLAGVRKATLHLRDTGVIYVHSYEKTKANAAERYKLGSEQGAAIPTQDSANDTYSTIYTPEGERRVRIVIPNKRDLPKTKFANGRNPWNTYMRQQAKIEAEKAERASKRKPKRW